MAFLIWLSLTKIKFKRRKVASNVLPRCFSMVLLLYWSSQIVFYWSFELMLNFVLWSVFLYKRFMIFWMSSWSLAFFERSTAATRKLPTIFTQTLNIFTGFFFLSFRHLLFVFRLTSEFYHLYLLYLISNVIERESSLLFDLKHTYKHLVNMLSIKLINFDEFSQKWLQLYLKLLKMKDAFNFLSKNNF